MLKVSISLPAQIVALPGSEPLLVHPAFEMLQPQLPMLIVASSSSSSSAFDVHRSPSDDPERITLQFVSASRVGAKDSVVISSECVESWLRSGVVG